MSREYVYLVGTEDMQRAANTFSGAVDDLRICDPLSQVENFMNYVERFEVAVRDYGQFTERFEKAVERLILDGPHA